MIFKTLWISALMLVALMVGGCAQAQTGPAIGTEDAAKVRTENTNVNCDAGKEPWRTAGTPKRGGTLTFPTSPPVDLDGGGFQNYQGLLQERKCTTYDREIVGALAESWQVSTDGLTWTLKLRPDVKWQNAPPVNGRQFTSADVAWMIDFQKKEGRERAYWSFVNHSTPDATTVILKLDRVDPDFIYKLGSGINVMKPREIKEQDGDFKKRAVGTGAFMVKDFKVNVSLIGKANPDFYLKGADGKPLPYIEELHQIAFADATAELAAMRAGQLDHSGVFGFRPDQIAALKQGNLKVEYYDILPPIHGSVWFDPKKAPWSDVRVRRAVMKAIDREGLIVSLQGGVTHSGFVPAAFTGLAWPEDKLKDKFKYDPEGAKALLAEAGFKGIADLTLLTTGQYAQEAEVVQNQLAKVGIVAKVEVAPDRSWTTVLEKGAFQLGWGVVGGAIAEFPAYYLCDYVETGNSLNTTRLSNPDVDRLCALQAKELDTGKRTEIWKQIHDKLYELVPVVPTVSTVYFHVMSCKIQNYKRVHLGRNPSGAIEAWIDQSKC